MRVKQVWLNLSQEAQTAIDELRMHGMIRMVRMYTIDYKPMSAYQVSQQGLRMMKAVPGALFDELKAVVYVPDHENSFTDRVQISWDDDKSLFALRSVKSGYLRYSTITEIEDVSYVSSPYIPAFLRRGQAETTNNRARAHHAFAGMTNIKDGDLMEVAPKKLAKDAARMENNSHQIWTVSIRGDPATNRCSYFLTSTFRAALNARRGGCRLLYLEKYAFCSQSGCRLGRILFQACPSILEQWTG